MHVTFFVIVQSQYTDFCQALYRAEWSVVDNLLIERWGPVGEKPANQWEDGIIVSDKPLSNTTNPLAFVLVVPLKKNLRN